MPTGLAQTYRHGHSRLSWLAAGARSAERRRRRMTKSGRTLAGQKLWTEAEIKRLHSFYPDYRKACAALPCRSLSAIKIKAFRLRITRSRQVWSESDLKRMKAPYRQGRPIYEILVLLPGKTKKQIWARASYSGWHRPRTSPKIYNFKAYDEIRDRAFASNSPGAIWPASPLQAITFFGSPPKTTGEKSAKPLRCLRDSCRWSATLNE